uniref:Uncharacterized protein n=3 Tax=Meloidogyne TaxID=189290 RepID=A0A6V7WGM5_MELEN|nr:unnamed protein product [Meloidogyne enterolobii]
MLNLYFVLKILMKKGFDNNTNHCQTTDVNEVRIENAIKQFDEIEQKCESFKDLIMSEAKSAGLKGSPNFEKLLEESAFSKNVPRGGSEDSRPPKTT